MYKIVAGIMRRRIALVGRGVAANGGQNRKATTPDFFTGVQGVGRGDSNIHGARMVPWASLQPTRAGLDSPALHIRIVTRLSSGVQHEHT